MKKVAPETVNAGDKVFPPAREMSLWMKRRAQEEGLPIEALLLTVTAIIPGARMDKKGPWTMVRANYTQEFGQGREIKFFVRPTTPLVMA